MKFDETLKRKKYNDDSFSKIPVQFLLNLPSINKKPGYTITKDLDEYLGLNYTEFLNTLIEDEEINTIAGLSILLGSVGYYLSGICVGKQEKVVLNYTSKKGTFTTYIEKNSEITDSIKELLDSCIDEYYNNNTTCPGSLLNAYSSIGQKDFNEIIEEFKQEISKNKKENKQIIENIKNSIEAIKDVAKADKKIDTLELSLRLYRACFEEFDFDKAKSYVENELKTTNKYSLELKFSNWNNFDEEFANLMYNTFICEDTNVRLIKELEDVI